MVKQSYQVSFVYEHYVSWARQCSYGQHNAKNSDMENLIDKENGESWVSHLTMKRVLSTVKREMIIATNFAIKRKISNADKNELAILKEAIEAAPDSTALLSICRQGMEVLRKYR